MSALISGLPGILRRTSSSAATTPKTAFSGTAMAAMISVSCRAWRAAGVVIAVPDGAEAVLEGAVEDHDAAAATSSDRAGSPARDAQAPRAPMSRPRRASTWAWREA